MKPELLQRLVDVAREKLNRPLIPLKFERAHSNYPNGMEPYWRTFDGKEFTDSGDAGAHVGSVLIEDAVCAIVAELRIAKALKDDD